MRCWRGRWLAAAAGGLALGLVLAGPLVAGARQGQPAALEPRARLPMVARDTVDEDAPGVVVVRRGEYVAGFEWSAFHPCGGAPWSPAWLASEDPEFHRRYGELVAEAGANPLEGVRVYAEIESRLELAAPGQMGFGHLGQYRAQVTVVRLLEMRAGRCEAGDGG